MTAGSARQLPAAIALLLVGVAFLLSACGGGGSSDSVGDFMASRRSDIYFRAFVNPRSGQTDDLRVVNTWGPFLDDNAIYPHNTDETTFQTTTATVRLYHLNALLVITNGISATLDTVRVKFTELDGSDVLDYRVTPPISTAGARDFVLKPSTSMVATPITSLGAFSGTNTEPMGTPTRFYVPINLFSTGIYEFQIGQGSYKRPLQAQCTFVGHDVLGNTFNLTGQVLMTPYIVEPRDEDGADGN